MKRYPLESLDKLREERRDERTRELSKRVATARARGQSVEGVVQKRRETEDGARARREREVERASVDGARAVDFQRLASHELHIRRELTELSKREAAAREALRSAQRDEELARQDLLQAEADRKVVARHREAFEAEQRESAERKAEEEAHDLHAAKARK